MIDKYIIGVDGGGSKTEAVSTNLCGKLLKNSISGSVNINSVGIEKAKRNLIKCLEDVKFNHIAEVCIIGAAGLENERNRLALMEAVNETYAKKTILTSDAKILYETVKNRGNVIVLICGTGSIAYTELNGIKLRTGGWGYLLGDEGGGFWIAKKAIMKMLKEYDEGKNPSNLSMKIMKFYRINNPPQIIEKVYGGDISEIARLAEEIAKVCDEEEDIDAIEIIDEAGIELAKIVKTLIKKSGINEWEVHCTGGLFNTSKRLFEKIKMEIEKTHPKVKVVKCMFRGIAGAIIMGLNEIGIKVNNDIISNLMVWAHA
ncbi:MAG: hypothetical protein N3E39_04425 [Candidatus Methanomethylicia archaeon]|nr:hypothetical protein [Candidatus Methanomethylicia archaeon]